MRSSPLRDWEKFPGSIKDYPTVEAYRKARDQWVIELRAERKAKREFNKLKKGPRGMAVHKDDKRAVKALIAQNKRLAANKARLVKKVLAAKAIAQKYELQAAGMMTSVDSIESQIQGNLSAIRGYSFGG